MWYAEIITMLCHWQNSLREHPKSSTKGTFSKQWNWYLKDYQEQGGNYKADKIDTCKMYETGTPRTIRKWDVTIRQTKWAHVKCTNAAPTNYTGLSFRDNKRKKNWGFFSLANARYSLMYAYYSRARCWVNPLGPRPPVTACSFALPWNPQTAW